MTTRIIIGDALEQIRLLPDESVHCCVTSPPYYGLRDYGVAAQIGLEPSPDEYVAALVAVLREVRRVLRKDGTLWLNIGDSYAGGGPGGGGSYESERHWRKGSGRADGVVDERGQRNRDGLGRITGVKPKNLIGVPWMLAFALRADGWWLRQDIIWSKPNPMPESVTDRCTKAHEYLFLLSKSERYWFDAAAIAEQAARAGDIAGGGPGYIWHGAGGHNKDGLRANGQKPVAETRNKRSVWTVASEPFPEAHFATFPPALIEPCILAGCPAGGTVLDPFGGAGTAGLVADRLGRNAILIELNPEYAEMARRRIYREAPLFAEIAMG